MCVKSVGSVDDHTAAELLQNWYDGNNVIFNYDLDSKPIMIKSSKRGEWIFCTLILDVPSKPIR